MPVKVWLRRQSFSLIMVWPTKTLQETIKGAVYAPFFCGQLLLGFVIINYAPRDMGQGAR
jgi:hypothetical protein